MVIAVNTQTPVENNSDETSDFIFEIFSRIISLHPVHTFVFICNEHIKNSFSAYNNIIYEILELHKKNVAQSYIWYNFKLPAILKKYNANLLVTWEVASSGNIPQCLIIPHLSFVRQPFLYKKSHQLFFKRFLPRSIKKAQAIITSSQFCKNEIVKHFNADANKIKIIYNGLTNKNSCLSYEERENIKAKYSEGNEYFIYAGEIGNHKNLLNLLKAFSAFKKRQKSSMQLFIVGVETYKYENFYEELRLFKFKKEVKIYNSASKEDVAKLIAASYAVIDPSKYEWFGTHLLKVMSMGVPVIASSTGVMPEMLADAALYADPENFKEIAVKMMALFKDENLRSALIEKGKLQVEKYNWDAAAEDVWQTIDKLI
jgi:glycosyltransferase involved in cell wall biosynthesis